MRNKNNWSADTSTANWKGGILAIWVSKKWNHCWICTLGVSISSTSTCGRRKQYHITHFSRHSIPSMISPLRRVTLHSLLMSAFHLYIYICISYKYHINTIYLFTAPSASNPPWAFPWEPPPHGGAYLALPWHLGSAKGEFPPGSTMEVW